jgi:hypothetical protein
MSIDALEAPRRYSVAAVMMKLRAGDTSEMTWV